MKKVITGIVLGILLFTVWIPGIAYADPGDGVDVDIVVVADEVNMDIDIYGDSNVSVNGRGLATLEDIDAAKPRGSQGDLITWLAARRADKWIREVGQFLPDATALLILSSEEHGTQLAIISAQLEEQGLAIGSNSNDIANLYGSIEVLTSYAMITEVEIEALQQFQIDTEKRWWIATVIATGVLVLIVILGINIGMRIHR